MKEKKALREMAKIMKVDVSDLPRTLRRFRAEVQEMKRQLKG